MFDFWLRRRLDIGTLATSSHAGCYSTTTSSRKAEYANISAISVLFAQLRTTVISSWLQINLALQNVGHTARIPLCHHPQLAGVAMMTTTHPGRVRHHPCGFSPKTHPVQSGSDIAGSAELGSEAHTDGSGRLELTTVGMREEMRSSAGVLRIHKAERNIDPGASSSLSRLRRLV
jgi:hypothetical protein